MNVIENNYLSPLTIVLCILGLLPGCSSLEVALSANMDTESITYEMALGYNKEDAYNILAFGNIGYNHADNNDEIATLGIVYEHYFSDTIGISGSVGMRYGSYTVYGHSYENDTYPFTRDRYDLILQAGIPFSWSYVKFTPYVGVVFNEKPKINAGISFAFRNQATVAALILVAAVANEGSEDDDDMDGIVELMIGIMNTPAEDKLPYPAWKYREQKN